MIKLIPEILDLRLCLSYHLLEQGLEFMAFHRIHAHQGRGLIVFEASRGIWIDWTESLADSRNHKCWLT